MVKIWKNRICNGDSLDINKEVHHDTCAICRHKLSVMCIDCKVEEFHDQIIYDHRIFMKYVWMFLLTMSKRNNTIFSNLDVNVLSIIYKYSISGNTAEMAVDCTTVLLECNHVFHKHCFEKWIHQRLCCPLCNSTKILPSRIYSYNRIGVYGQLDNVFESKYTNDELIQRSEDEHYVRGVIYDILKHNIEGRSYESLYIEVCHKFNRYIDDDIFASCIQNLIQKEYIYTIDDIYYHLP